MDIVNSAVTLDGEELVDAFFGLLLAVFERGIGFGNLLELGAREVAADGERNDEVTVGEALHKSRSAEAVCTVVGEVGFTENEAARNRGHQIVVNPEAAHGVVDGREDTHRDLVRVFVGNLFVHLEEVAVLGRHACNAHALNSVGEVEVHGLLGVTHAETCVADLLGVTGCHVTGHEVTEARVLFFEVVVTVFFRNLVRAASVASLARNPNTAVVTERFAHQGELGLQVAVARNASRVNLRVAGVSEQGAALVGTESGRHVGTLGVCRKVVDVTVTAGAEAHSVTHVAFEFASDEVTDDDTASLAVDNDEVHHFAAGEHLHLTGGNLAHEGLVGTEQELLTRLTAGVERTGNLRTTERAVVEKATVFTTERNALGHALVDD